MSLPNFPLWIGLKEATDHELHRMLREHKGFLGAIDVFVSRVKNRSKAIQSEIDQRKQVADRTKGCGKKPILVTDHAIVRYLERVHGIDIDQITAEILENVKTGEKYMNGALTINDGMVFVRRRGTGDEVISTIMPEGYLEEDDIELAGELYERDKNE